MRVALLDIGTNTVLLLIADVVGSSLQVIRDDHAIARLGEGVDRTHRISEDAYNRFIGIVRTHCATIEQFHSDRIAAIATSAMRDAENREEIIQRTKQDTGIDIELLSGEDEARWTYCGAVHGMIAEGSSTIIVIDVGGGSTEISFGIGDKFRSGTSFDMGAVRITERFFSHGISANDKDEARSFIQTLLGDHLHSARNEHVIAVAGTPTTLAAMDLTLPAFDAQKVHGHLLSREVIDRLMNSMHKLSIEELLKQYPAVNKARADILPAGTLILSEIMDYFQTTEITVSTQGLRYGIALRAAQNIS